MKLDYRKSARKLKELGISVVPLRTDGSKLPKIRWGHLQQEVMSDKEIEYQFKKCGGIAAITGKVSRLYVLDFDLKYQFQTQDYWKAFMERVPKEVRKKLLINATKNNGRHAWMRTDFEDQSRHYTRRVATIPELQARYDQLIKENADPLQVSEQILRAPYEVVIESRSRGSYAVIQHGDYDRIYGKTFQELSIEEVEMLNDAAYSLDYEFIEKKVYNTDVGSFKSIRKFNDDTTPQEVVAMLEDTGMYRYVGKEYGGNLLVVRVGSKNKYSAKIFADNSVLHLHSSNCPLFDITQKRSISPFEVFMVSKGLTHEQAVNELNKG